MAVFTRRAWIASFAVLVGLCGDCAAGPKPMPPTAHSITASRAPATVRSTVVPPSQATSALSNPKAGSLGNLSWSAPPPPWTLVTVPGECWFTPSDFGAGLLAVALTTLGSNAADLCGAGVWNNGRWSIQAFATGSQPSATTGTTAGSFAVSDGTDVYVYANGRFVQAAQTPTGQNAVSVVPLPSGGVAIGTAAIWHCGMGGACGTTDCPNGRILIAQNGTVRTYQLPKATLPPASPPVECGVSVGAISGEALWFGVTGVGVSELDLTTGAFGTFPQGGATSPYFLPQGGLDGPVQVLGASSASVYFSVHRPVGGGFAGYFAGLNVLDVATRSSTTYDPAPPSPCVDPGKGAPSTAVTDGSVLWVAWLGASCPIYTWTSGVSTVDQLDLRLTIDVVY